MSMNEAVSPPNPVTSALAFWEPGRIVYNLVLAVLVLGFSGFDQLFRLSVHGLSTLLGLALLANLAYTLAYPIDLFVQRSEFAQPWRRYGRPLLWLLGTGASVVVAASTVLSLGPLLR